MSRHQGSYARLTVPASPSTVIALPCAMVQVASPVPTTAGTPNSRATIEAWLMGPPVSVTNAGTRQLVCRAPPYVPPVEHLAIGLPASILNWTIYVLERRRYWTDYIDDLSKGEW